MNNVSISKTHSKTNSKKMINQSLLCWSENNQYEYSSQRFTKRNSRVIFTKLFQGIFSTQDNFQIISERSMERENNNVNFHQLIIFTSEGSIAATSRLFPLVMISPPIERNDWRYVRRKWLEVLLALLIWEKLFTTSLIREKLKRTH